MAGKKKSVWQCGISAMLVMALPIVPKAGAEEAAATFAPPQTQLLLTRTLHRPLPDGKAIVTRRSYALRIFPDGTGYRVEGALIDARVDAPPALAALAEIERRRPDTGNFPIMLDSKGLILGGTGLQSDGSLDRAATVAAEAIGGSGLPAVDMLQVQAFIEQLPSRAPRSAWPADVFHPAPGRRSESRAVPLPGGVPGQVTIEIEAQGPDQDGQLASLSRVVTTDLAGDVRVTREQWRLDHGLPEVGR